MRVIPPLIVIEGPDDAFASAVAEAGAAGWRVRDGFEGQAPGAGPVVRTGAVTCAEDAANALLAVLAGAGVVVHGLGPRDVIDRLLDDLRHVGLVEHRRRLEPSQPSLTASAPVLDPDELEILRMLGEGRSLGDAADALGLSRRTADRRLAGARRALGAERTVEAVAKARRLGWLR
jgi:DNA-binding CsgD family transcriptional regulator